VKTNDTPARPQISIHRVLMATDFSECSSRALQHALAVARHYKAELDLVHVIQPFAYSFVGYDAMVQAHDLAEREIKEFVYSLQRNRALEGIDHRCWVFDGDVAEIVRRIVRSHRTDLVVVGTHGRSGLRKLVLGSVAEDVFRQSPCPVLTVGPYSPGMAREPRLKHVLFATDFSAASEEALPWAVSAAQEFGARLTALHVRPELKGEDAQDRDRMNAALQERRRDLLASVSNQVNDAKFEIQTGDPATMILEVAAAHDIDLIVFGLKPLRSFSDRVPWVQAYDVVCEAACPVLTVRGHLLR